MRDLLILAAIMAATCAAMTWAVKPLVAVCIWICQ